jgi:prevent-host-death family protein
MKFTDARQHFSEVVNKVFRGQTRVIVEKSGIPVAAIVSTGDLDELNRMRNEREEDFKALDATRQAFKDVPFENIDREVDRAIREARAKARSSGTRAAKAS